MSVRVALLVLVAAVVPAPSWGAARSWNLYEWMAVAPIVAVGEVQVDDQRYVEIRLTRVLRGELSPGDVVRVDQRRANRERPDGTARLDLLRGHAYAVLLAHAERRRRDDDPSLYDLVRGTAGAREVGESGAAWVEAAASLAGWQDRRDEVRLWADLTRALADPNPALVETALDLFLKFRRGGPEVLAVARPLLDSGRADFREKAAVLVGRAVAAGASRADPSPAESEAVLALVAAARRDEVVAVRVAATRALGEVDATPALEALREIARSDPDQAVRYEAQRLLVEGAPAGRPAAFDLPRSAP